MGKFRRSRWELQQQSEEFIKLRMEKGSGSKIYGASRGLTGYTVVKETVLNAALKIG